MIEKNAGKMRPFRVPAMRGLDPGLRRARLLAARTYRVGTIPRHGILGGYWDHGSAVRQFMQ